MENPQFADMPDQIPERDIVAMLTMLDYLVAEISKIDAMSAQCLMLARKTLAEAVADALVKAN
jgi:hypothetical protein